ncbi:hypothetical protein BLTE_15220 [Blastochloris tepida]|uniref:Uncharacterized protein n=2 Tax=Blastochloris tepida TaxID=2233851 RepID=A0A348FZV4_9HYPH|nr:hypothetical protein BLTE_15220 [Blastochloris tepida]
MIDDRHVEAMRNDMLQAITLVKSGPEGEAAFTRRLMSAVEGAALGKEKLTDLISLTYSALQVAATNPADHGTGVPLAPWLQDMAMRLLIPAMRIAGAMEDRPPGPVN